MLGRTQLLMAASTLLYLGPLLAGMSGMGWAAVPVFVALSALWLVVMRPAQWPRDVAKWTSAIVLTAGAQVAVNTLIVVLLFAIGRGLAGIQAFRLDISPMIPVALSFLSTPLSRLVWDPIKADAVDGVVDDALRQIDQPGPQIVATQQDDMVKTLLALAPDADPLLMVDAIDVALRPPHGETRLQALEEALDAPDADHRALREALILWATDLRRTVEDGVAGAQESAFAIAGHDPALLTLFADRALALIRAKPALWTYYPDAVDVSCMIEAASPADLQAALTALATAIEAASEAA